MNKKNNKLTGGKGDNLSQDKVDYRELEIGIQVELEHTNNKEIAKEIALDHLSEKSTYYTDLIKSKLVDEPKAINIYKKYFKTNTSENKMNTKNLIDKIIKEEIEKYKTSNVKAETKPKQQKPETVERKEKIKVEEDQQESNEKWNELIEKVRKVKKQEDYKDIKIKLDDVPKNILKNCKDGLYMKKFGVKDKEDKKFFNCLKNDYKFDDCEAQLIYFISKGIIKQEPSTKKEETKEVKVDESVKTSKKTITELSTKAKANAALENAIKARIPKLIEDEWSVEYLQDLMSSVEERLNFVQTLLDKVKAKQVKGFGKDIKGIKF